MMNLIQQELIMLFHYQAMKIITILAFDVSFRSDRRKKISYRINPSIGQFYNGNKYSLETSLSLRLQPYFSGSIQMNYDKIDLPDPYPDASIWLIGPKLDITFNKNMFWSTFFQYSTQRENLKY